MIDWILAAADSFWRRYPALLYAIAAAIGVNIGVVQPPAHWVYLLLFWLPLVAVRGYASHKTLMVRLLLSLALALTMAYYVAHLHRAPTLTPHGEKGWAVVSVNKVQRHHTHFGSQWIYKSTILQFIPQNPTSLQAIGYYLPATIRLPADKYNDEQRPKANKTWKIFGTLKELTPHHWFFKPDAKVAWEDYNDGLFSNFFNLSEIRYTFKTYLHNYIRSKYSDKVSIEFLTGLATGDFDDRQLSYQFSRFGLSHILAISGFHFALFSGLLSFVLGIALPQRVSAIFLAIVLTAYFLFLGPSPSILRAWITIVISTLALALGRVSSGVNALGCAILAALLWEPLLLYNIGFQLSVATTAAILLYFPWCDTFLKLLTQKHALDEALELRATDKHVFIWNAFFRKAIALSLAVNIVALPLSLYLFHKLPLLSFFYNLFFPFLASLSMTMLWLGVLFDSALPRLAGAIHAVNDYLTSWLMDLTYRFPTSFDYVWRVHPPAEAIAAYLTAMLCLAIALHRHTRTE